MNLKKLLIVIPFFLLAIAFWRIRYPDIFQIGKKTKTTPTLFPTPLPSLSLNKSYIKWGAYAGPSVNNAIDFQQKVGRHPSFLPIFIHWGNENKLPYQFTEYAVLEKQTLVIYWEAMDYNDDKPENNNLFSYDQILNGTWDKYIKSFADSLKKYGHPVILIPFEEMNGDWYPWSVSKNNNTPEKHVAAYRYVRNFFKNVPNVKFAWVINNDTLPNNPQNQPSNYYPGNAYVDYVGVNGFNFGSPWQNFDEIFSKSISYLESLNEPIMIFSMASAPGPKKADWIKDATTYITSHPKIEGWIWFNENKEKDWPVWSDDNSLQAFRDYLTAIVN